MKAHLKRLLPLAAVIFSSLRPIMAADKVTLVMWHNHPEWKERVEAILQKFEASHPNITFDLEEIGGADYTARLNTALAAGEAPDLISISPGPEMRGAAESDYLVDLTSLLDIDGGGPGCIEDRR
jgi:multiple sugar transport system substrate-binding protein